MAQKCLSGNLEGGTLAVRQLGASLILICCNRQNMYNTSHQGPNLATRLVTTTPGVLTPYQGQNLATRLVTTTPGVLTPYQGPNLATRLVTTTPGVFTPYWVNTMSTLEPDQAISGFQYVEKTRLSCNAPVKVNNGR